MVAKARRPVGRPSEFTAELADTICERLVEGESLRSICATGKGMPSASTVCRWLAMNAEFQQQYARAREAQADTLADEMLDIADDGRNDWVERQGKDGEAGRLEYNGDHVQRSRLRIDARKWLASKMAPKKYGEKLDVEHSGELKVEIVRFADDSPPEPLDP